MTRRLTFCVLGLLISECLFARGRSLSPATQWATVAAYETQVFPNIVYKRANAQNLKLDVITWGSPSKIRPTVIYIHGGGWVGGSKGQYELWTLPFLAEGMDVVNVEYRLADVSLAPAAVEDCRCALRWVYQHAKDYRFDTTKLVVAGHSAGGHLALMTGMLDPSAGFDSECPARENLRVAAIVDFFGITDVPDVLAGPLQEDWWAVQWFGALPNRMELARQLSPLTYVRKGLPPIIIIHGTRDPLVPYQEAVHLHEALDRVGDPNELVTIQGGHGGWTREQNLKAEKAVFDFLRRYGVLPQ